jgi:hypothetical protein
VAGDEARGVAGQEQRRLGDVLGLAGDRQRLGVDQHGVGRRLAEHAPPPRIGVETPPGAMQLMRIMSAANSIEAERVRFTTPALAAQ